MSVTWDQAKEWGKREALKMLEISIGGALEILHMSINYSEFLKRCAELGLPPRVYQADEWDIMQQAKHRTLPKITEEQAQLALQHAAETGREISAMRLSEAAQQLLRDKIPSGETPQQGSTDT
jgi:hypothetical protein